MLFQKAAFLGRVVQNLCPASAIKPSRPWLQPERSIRFAAICTPSKPEGVEALCKKPGFLPEVVMLVIAQKPGFFCTSKPEGVEALAGFPPNGSPPYAPM
jgi:hypothetical protein